MDIEISIIVPVYNLEHLLPKCVESILSQTFTKFELILVNDGSTDSSGKICDDFAEIDKRVVVIHKDNGGTASCRNVGLDTARGRYIGFVDNDDYINENMFETLYDQALRYSSDIVQCDYKKVDEDEEIDMKLFDGKYEIQHLNKIEALNQLYTDNALTFVCPWNKLYRKSLFVGIKYEEGFINDDETVIHKLLYNSKKITYIHKELYYYVQRNGSQMNSSFNIKRLDMVYALKEREEFFRINKEYELHQKALKHFMEKFFWYYYLVKNNLHGVEKDLKSLKRTFDQCLIHLLKHKEISWKQKIMFIIFRIKPSVYDYVAGMRSKT